MNQIYNKGRHPYTAHDRHTIIKLFTAGSNDEEIGKMLGRTAKAIKCQRTHMGLRRTRRKDPRLEPVTPTKGAKYTRYMKPQTEVSILWGLIKYTKA